MFVIGVFAGLFAGFRIDRRASWLPLIGGEPLLIGDVWKRLLVTMTLRVDGVRASGLIVVLS